MQNFAQVLVSLDTTQYFIYKNDFFKFWYRRNKAINMLKFSKLSKFNFFKELNFRKQVNLLPYYLSILNNKVVCHSLCRQVV